MRDNFLRDGRQATNALLFRLTLGMGYNLVPQGEIGATYVDTITVTLGIFVFVGIKMLIEVIGHTTYVLLAISYLVRDIVWLRIIAIPASLCSMAFCYWGVDEPIWLIIGWNCVFLVVNGYQLGVIRYSIRKSYLVPAFRKLWDELNGELKMLDVVKLYQSADLRTYHHRHELTRRGAEASAFYFLVAGSAEVTLADGRIKQCRPGSFLGEISFLTLQPCTATIRASPNAQLLVWNIRKLRRRLRSNPVLEQGLGRHLARILRDRLVVQEQSVSEKSAEFIAVSEQDGSIQTDTSNLDFVNSTPTGTAPIGNRH